MEFNDVDLLAHDTHKLTAEPLYEWLREKAPLYRDEKNALWAVSRYDDVVFVSKHTEIFCNRFGVVPGIPLDRWPDEAMINLDGDEHTCQRALVSKGFTPRRIAALEDEIRTMVDDLIGRVAAQGECDLVRDFARPLPMRVIGQMLGYPPARNDEVLDWTDVYVHAGAGGMENITGEVMAAFGNFCSFHQEILADRKEKRGNDLISVWLDAEVDGKRLGEQKLLYEHNLLLVGGSETTRHAISIGMHELLKRPADLAFLTENPAAIPNAVEEMVRFACPFVRMQRTLLSDHTMHGRSMKEGDKIVVLYPAANRDPRVWDRPQEFDIRRSFDKPALSFGFGKHYCLGASLARLEIKVFLERVLPRLTDLRLVPDREAVDRPSAFIRGLVSLPVRFTPVAAAVT
jgi:cytochrome P450 family 142 subfamily A polypeptide 1